MPGFWLILTGLALASLGLTGLAWMRDRQPDWRFQPPAPLPENGPPRFETLFDFSVETGQAHSPAIRLNDEGFTLLWFQGSQEARADIEIHGQSFTDQGKSWQPSGAPGPVLTSKTVGDAFEPDQLVVTMGNVVQDDANRNDLFATVVSLGGWAMSSVARITMSKDRPQHVEKLSLSPLLGRSQLVKSPMVAYADGSHGLPAYYEVNHVFSEMVRFDAHGRVRDKRRMTSGPKVIQPMVVPLDETRAIALMRNYINAMKGQMILETGDGGRTWGERPSCGLPNPGAPVAALNLGDGRILIAFNDDEERADLFRLAISEDEGHSWRRIHTLEDGNGDPEQACRYPMMRALPCGDILLTYSVNSKRGVRAHLFNRAWVDVQ